MRIVSEAEVRRTLEPAKVIAAIEEAFRNHHQTAVAPTRLQQPLGKNGTLLLMPCYDSSYGASGLKIVTVAGQRPGGGTGRSGAPAPVWVRVGVHLRR